ncbi:MAG: glycerol-3-phosphate dehydrogenase/oxidase [Planctomycetaceae bacterium]|nr:glycerol-3-phosphate dehydrogenase/oxidase [Planctomycetaceae bacterium]
MSQESGSSASDLDRLAEGQWDVLIVGGGIVGSGVARDAAMRGLRVALVDRHDFAFGTSSRSSRLLHGGLRYLAQGRVGLVHEASVEKLTLHRIAPHLAAPLPFLFPTYRGTPWIRWQLSIGVKIYDLLCGRRNLGPSSTLSASRMAEKLPDINRRRLTGGVRYYDGLTSDSRLALDTLRSAVRQGAWIRNYTSLVGADPSSSGWICRVRDEQSQRQVEVRARAVVNSTGCWADQMPHSRVRLRLTKGIHLVVDQQRFPANEAVVMAEGKRILFVIPWGQRVILGTTDTDYDGSLEDVPTDEEDIAYVLGVTNEMFPPAKLQPSDVIAHWAGVRPLIASGREKEGSPSNTSRNHQIRMPEPGWIDVAGGKLTTYRLMAEQTVDLVGRHLKTKLPACRTGKEPLLEPAAAAFSGVLPSPVTREAVEHYCKQEWAVHLDDVMVRRSSWHYYDKDAASVAEQAATWMKDLLGWDDATRQAELERYRHATR